MASDVVSPAPSPDGKVSRYRSLRQARSNSPPPPLPPVPSTIADNNGVKRSQSRYHRAHTTESAQAPPSLRVRSDRPSRVRTAPERQRVVEVPLPGQPPLRNVAHAVSLPNIPPPSSRTAASAKSSTRTSRRNVTTPGYQPYGGSEAKQILAQEQARYDRIKSQQRAEKEAKDKAIEAERLAREQEEWVRDKAVRDAAAAEQLKRDEVASEELRRKAEKEERKAREREEAELHRERNRLQKEARRPADIRAPTRDEYDSAPSMLTPSTAASTSAPNSAKLFGGFFKRRKDEPHTSSPPHAAAAAAPLLQSPTATSAPILPPVKISSSLTKPELPMIKPGGKGIVPLTDAPISASNHGDRRVRIECGNSFISLPFTPTTSTLQLIRSASTVMSEPIDPRASVMYEIFTKAGVRRPLRMYEHVRDVVNSWDNDNQHSLHIVPSEIGHDNELYVSFAPKQRPQDQFWWLTYSPKPGKWDKRWVTMRTDGQVIMAKNESGKESVNICHLSDFEIYTPTLEQKKKVIRPPKKYCYCVKSQQKSSMFLEAANSNFIHFFCSNDKENAEGFFSTVQNWRSWYLVNVMGEGLASKGEQKAEPETKPANGLLARKSDDYNAKRDSYYVLGTLGTLNIDFTSFAPEPEQPRDTKRRSVSMSESRPLGLPILSALEHSKQENARKEAARQEQARQEQERREHGRVHPSRLHPPRQQRPRNLSPRNDNQYPRRERQHPPIAFRGQRDGLQQRPSTARSHANGRSSSQGDGEDNTFNANGLLGAQYIQRQQHLQPASDSNGLRRSGSLRSTLSRRNSVGGGSIKAPSIRGSAMPKPLIDLTPQYKDPPQFQKKGKGFKPDFVGVGGLIESVPSPDDPFALPTKHEWRARPLTSSGNPPSQRAPMPPSGPDPMTKSLRGHGVKVDSREEKDAFTGGGLLAKSGQGWGNGDKGHNVMNGHMAKGPMVDLMQRSKFADGSLLRRVERETGHAGTAF